MGFPRCAGILLHPTSLPGGHGVGDLGAGARRFVDFLSTCGLKLWQMLPLGPTGAANSPYQCLSSFAGNELLISLEELCADGLLAPADLGGASFAAERVDYARAREFKERALARAFAAFAAGKGGKELGAAHAEFLEENRDWLDAYALFAALKKKHGGAPWYEWGVSARDRAALAAAQRELQADFEYNRFRQFLFFRQWRALREYAAARNVKLMGDIPIYVAHDSADTWADPQYFELDADGQALKMAGVPPDYFSATGQLWGNPIYKWDRLAKDGFSWWIARIKATLAMVDVLRIDHFRGFEAYWEVPAGEKTAVNGEWIKGPGQAFFTALRKALGELPIVAEDLGTITAEVRALKDGEGLPGMKVLQFAFCDGAEMYLPHSYDRNCVVYTATHDNDTTLGWYKAEGPDYAAMDRETLRRERQKARQYLARDGYDFVKDLIRLALASVADTAVIPMQDVLFLDNCCRMNRPGVTDGQWEWRMTERQLTGAAVDMLREMVWLYQR